MPVNTKFKQKVLFALESGKRICAGNYREMSYKIPFGLAG